MLRRRRTRCANFGTPRAFVYVRRHADDHPQPFRICTPNRPKRLVGRRRQTSRRLAADDLQPHPRWTVADHPDARRVATGAPRLGGPGNLPGQLEPRAGSDHGLRSTGGTFRHGRRSVTLPSRSELRGETGKAKRGPGRPPCGWDPVDRRDCPRGPVDGRRTGLALRRGGQTSPQEWRGPAGQRGATRRPRERRERRCPLGRRSDQTRHGGDEHFDWRRPGLGRHRRRPRTHGQRRDNRRH